jgi:heme exporter protein A
MVQRLQVARALLHDPQLLLLDEPYSGLDAQGTQILDNLIANIRENRTLIMVSHDASKGFSLATHLLVLAQGKSQLFCAKADTQKQDFLDSYHAIVKRGVA